MKQIIKLINRFDEILILLSSIVIFVMMLWIFVDVTFRTLFNNPIIGTVEITGEYFMVFIVYFAISYTMKEDSHVSVDLLTDRFTKNTQRVLRLFNNILAIIVLSILGFITFSEGVDYFLRDVTSVGLLDYPLAPALFVISFGIFLLCLRLIIDTANIILNKDNDEKHGK